MAAERNPRLSVALVAGESMLPDLPPGSWILVAAPGCLRARVGRVTVVQHPTRPGLELVKRVSALSLERQLLWVAGDNSRASSDSESFGPLPLTAVRGWALARLRPWPPRWLLPDPAKLMRSSPEPSPNLARWHHRGRND
ncbi:MAG: S26 family signal peptidase [Candidatus Dormibacteria bacterium]